MNKVLLLLWNGKERLQYAEKYAASILKQSATISVITLPQEENKEKGLADQKREMNSFIAEANRESAKWSARY